MAGETTLIVTTRSGVRPLGVRGEPLHNAAPQLRRVVRRRLGDGAADLLADPQLHEDGKAIDWYAGWPGAVQPLSALDAARRRSESWPRSSARWPTSAAWATRWPAPGPREDIGLVGLSLQLAARAPAESFVFMVGDRPVDRVLGLREGSRRRAAAGRPAAPPLPSPAAHRAVLEAPVRCRRAGAPAAPGTTIPWLRTLLLALPLLLLLLGGAWLLRELLPADPALALATREGPPAPPAAGAAARSAAGAEGRLLDRAIARAHAARSSWR